MSRCRPMGGGGGGGGGERENSFDPFDVIACDVVYVT